MNTGKSYKTKLLEAAFLWSLLFVFVSPQFVQLIHQFDDNNHGHHEMHQARALNFHDQSDTCAIFSFEYSSFQKAQKTQYLVIAQVELFTRLLFSNNNIESSPNFQLQLLRAPPLSK